MNIQEVIFWASGILGAITIILKFVEDRFVQPIKVKYEQEKQQSIKDHEVQIQQLEVTSTTNERLALLTEELRHNNKMREAEIKQNKDDISKIDNRLTDSYLYLDEKIIGIDGRVLDIERICFIKDRID